MRPKPDEFAPDYQVYVDRVEGDDVRAVLAAQPAQVEELLGNLTPQQAGHRYGSGKWSLEEVLGHVIDVEWVFHNRVLRIGRGDTTPLPGVDQDVLMDGARFEGALPSLLAELRSLREASGLMLARMTEEDLDRRGTASGMPFSARALCFIIAGHAGHHLEVIRERYL